MAVINRPDRDFQRANQLRLIAAGKLPVSNLRVKTPQGYTPVRHVIRVSHDVYRLET